MKISYLDSPIGVLTLVASDVGLTRVMFEGDTLEDHGLPADLPEDDSDPTLAAAAAQLGEYFAGDRQEFEIDLDPQGTEFQRDAWYALAKVPYGETRSYGQQAEFIGRPGAFRAVGAANGRNPIPIILPCHRIVGANGDLTGFAGGLDTKRRLLNHEQAQQGLPGI